MVRVTDGITARRRLVFFQVMVIGLGLVLFGRLGYLQVVQHGKYKTQASNEHTRKYQIPSARGQIYMYDGNLLMPVVLNQTLKLLYADPHLVNDKADTARKLAAVTGASAADYQRRLEAGIEYVVLDRRLSEAVAAKIRDLKLRGVGLKDTEYRNYPEGSLAAQLLGFVNADGEGQYGVEGYLNNQLRGTPGQLAAKTDTHGVPIATADNVMKPAVPGTSYALTIDRNIQAMAEQELAEQVSKVKAKSGSIVVTDPMTGAVKAMANYPTYEPANYASTKDYSVFVNQVVSNQFEPGSGIKALTMAAGLDQGKIKPDTTFDDYGSVKVGDRVISNAHGDKPGKNKTMTVVLRDSLNTGVMFVLRMLGDDPNKITLSGKKTLYNYFTAHFGLGSRTGIEQAGEAAGYIPGPTTNDVTYANMSFGQGMSATMIQMVAAMGAIANGGTLYQPRLVDGVVQADGTVQRQAPKVVSSHVMGEAAIRDLTQMLTVVVERGSGYKAKISGYEGQIAGKTGTAQVANPNGVGYIEGANIGSFVGFAPVRSPKFVLMVRINEPQVVGFAEVTTVPVFRDMCDWLFKYYGVAPNS